MDTLVLNSVKDQPLSVIESTIRTIARNHIADATAFRNACKLSPACASMLNVSDETLLQRIMLSYVYSSMASNIFTRPIALDNQRNLEQLCMIFSTSEDSLASLALLHSKFDELLNEGT